MHHYRVLRGMTNIKPDNEQIERIEKIREVYKDVVRAINYYSKGASEEMDEAYKTLQTSLMWAVKAIVLETEEVSSRPPLDIKSDIDITHFGSTMSSED